MLDLDVTQIGLVPQISDGQFLLDVLPAYRVGLDGLQKGDQVQILYWMHETGRHSSTSEGRIEHIPNWRHACVLF